MYKGNKGMSDIKVARINIEPTGDSPNFYFHMLRRTAGGTEILKQPFKLADLKIPDYDLDEAIKKAYDECLNKWYNSDMDASVFVISYNGKNLVYQNPQAI